MNITDGMLDQHIQKPSGVRKRNRSRDRSSFDGDGDRCIAVDENEQSVDGDKNRFIPWQTLQEPRTCKEDKLYQPL